jgi:ATP-GRASP peptide maturase of grasp-with-spasm system
MLTDHLNDRLKQEDRRLREHFHHVLRNRCAVLGSADGSSPNKLVVLELARELGLRTPPFRVTTSRQYTQVLLDSGASYVSKAMSDGLYAFDVKESRAGYFTYTELLESSSLEGLDERIAPSFFQQYIEKTLELRVFFLDKTFRTVGIVSQTDEQTRVDYRKYNLAKPNRMIPFQLPREIEDKLSLLADRLGLNTGSIDLILDEAGEFYFLEVNPVGQFGPLSADCNLSIERLIAERLLAHEQ